MAQIEIYKKEEMATKAADHFLEKITQILSEQDICRIAVSGGSTPKETFAILSDPSLHYVTSIPWERVQIFFVDERTVPPTHNDSNYLMTKNTLLKAPIQEGNVFRYKAELPPQDAAQDYSNTIKTAFGVTKAWDIVFDIVQLGMGDDGHTASLFPGTEALNVDGGIAVANHVPQLNTWRLTLTKDIINRAQHVFFLIGGANKAQVLKDVLFGEYNPTNLPTQLIEPSCVPLYILDEAAAELVK